MFGEAETSRHGQRSFEPFIKPIFRRTAIIHPLQRCSQLQTASLHSMVANAQDTASSLQSPDTLLGLEISECRCNITIYSERPPVCVRTLHSTDPRPLSDRTTGEIPGTGNS